MALTMALPREMTLSEKFVQKEFLDNSFLNKVHRGKVCVRKVSG